jgi:hypothetical protein
MLDEYTLLSMLMKSFVVGRFLTDIGIYFFMLAMLFLVKDLETFVDELGDST